MPVSSRRIFSQQDCIQDNIRCHFRLLRSQSAGDLSSSDLLIDKSPHAEEKCWRLRLFSFVLRHPSARIGGSRYLLLAATFSMFRLHTRTWECLCVSSYLLIIMAAPAFSECVVWTPVHFAESLKRCDLYVTLAAIFQQCTEPRQSYNCRYVIIQAIHFSSDTERFWPQKMDITHVDCD